MATAPSKPIEIDRARELVLDRASALGTEQVALSAALGRVLAERAVSTEPVPGADNSAMDGFAVRAADTAGAEPGSPVVLREAGEARAGHPAGSPLCPGEAMRISTGAVLPLGADAVVRVEDTRCEDGRILVGAEIDTGRDVRRAGEDIAEGEEVLERGARIGPAEIGVLASLGLPTVRCHLRPRLRVLTTGDELIAPGEPMRPGGVRNSNAYAVPALAERAGAEVLSADLVPDDADATREAIAAALDADVLVVCGGVSVGEHDHVKRALAELGVEEGFWGIALKPGKPTWFGSRDGKLVFGLPGNPVSAMVTFTLLARPALAALGGAAPDSTRTRARLARDQEKQPGRAHAVRCRLELDEEGWLATPTGPQGSHILSSMLGADCLALLPTESGPVQAGERVEIELLDRE